MELTKEETRFLLNLLIELREESFLRTVPRLVKENHQMFLTLQRKLHKKYEVCVLVHKR